MTNYYDENTVLRTEGASDKPKSNSSEGQAWKKISIGSAAGILMGGGAAFAAHQYYTQEGEVVKPIESATENRDSVGYHTTENGLQVAEVSEDMSYQEAFEAARAAVGPGGVFHWHGGVYNTYTPEEWATMSEAERSAFAQQVQPEIPVSQVEVSQDPVHTVVVIVPEESIDSKYNDMPVIGVSHNDDPVHEDPIIIRGEYEATDIDGHMVAVRPLFYEGHEGVEIDLNLDGDADLAVVDVNDNGIPDQDEYVVLNDDVVASYYGTGTEEHIPQPDVTVTDNYIAQNDIAPDMPDYYNDADVSGIA